MAKVLLIEDDPLIYRMYQRVLVLEGFEVELAHDGQAGLDTLRTFVPDIILLDVMMPGMNGMEFLDKLKADPALSNIPVVVLTNMAEVNIMQMATSKGAALHIVKSRTDPSDMVGLVRGVLAQRNAGTSTVESPAPAEHGQA